MADARDLDDALDELYGVRPSEFVATRKALVSELRSAGDADAAKQLVDARRPTTAAWALNQLAREHPALVDDLLERGAQLRKAQSRASAGGADRLREATAARRAALDTAADAAVALADEVAANPEAHRDAIAATLEAASVDDTIGAALRAGRLVREAIGAVGFPEVATLSLVQDPVQPKARARSRGGDGTAALEAAESEARRAAQRASELSLTVGEAEQRLDERRAELDQAQSALREAQSVARRARNELEAAQRAASAADRAVEKARRKLDGFANG